MKSKDYKVTINHKLNFKLKPKAGTGELFPLYLEVRAKRQITFLKSRFGAYVTKETFEVFLKDDLVKLALEYEKAEIENSIRNFGINEDNFLLTSWYEAYSKQLSESKWPDSVIKRMVDPIHDFCITNNISEDDIKYYFSKKEQIESTIRILSALNYPQFIELYDSLSYQKILMEAFSAYDVSQVKNKKPWIGYIGISEGLDEEALITPFFELYLDRVNRYPSSSQKDIITIENIIGKLHRQI